MDTQSDGYEGGCTCGFVRYTMKSKPMIVHGCHCRYCQKQSGAAFAINALVEADEVKLNKGEVIEITVASPSGKGQKSHAALNARLPSGAII